MPEKKSLHDAYGIASDIPEADVAKAHESSVAAAEQSQTRQMGQTVASPAEIAARAGFFEPEKEIRVRKAVEQYTAEHPEGPAL